MSGEAGQYKSGLAEKRACCQGVKWKFHKTKKEEIQPTGLMNASKDHK
ncbi:hypothetical protein BSG1_20825 [Bacillus sp. SG-1]|nr:hypothetical protein BSG1_20825 [Bacillus sp. SG-1]